MAWERKHGYDNEALVRTPHPPGMRDWLDVLDDPELACVDLLADPLLITPSIFT